jgi:hypothetical protein
MLGCAVAVSAALSLINILRLVEVWIIMKLHPYRLDALKPLAAGAGAFFVLFIVRTRLIHFESPLLSMASGAFVFGVCYTVILTLLGIAEEDKLVFNRIKRKILN